MPALQMQTFYVFKNGLKDKIPHFLINMQTIIISNKFSYLYGISVLNQIFFLVMSEEMCEWQYVVWVLYLEGTLFIIIQEYDMYTQKLLLPGGFWIKIIGWWLDYL